MSCCGLLSCGVVESGWIASGGIGLEGFGDDHGFAAGWAEIRAVEGVIVF